jgi:phosphoesterase RecJ-like protein
VAAECYARGADVRRVTQQLYRNRGLEALQLWGDILMRLTLNARWGVVATVIRRADLARYQLNDEAIEGLANFMNSIVGIKAALVLTELDRGELKGSYLTTRDTIDVSRLAVALGGGGHRKAAGFTIPGRVVETPRGWRIE